MLTFLTWATLAAVATMVGGVVAFLANVFQVRDGLARRSGGNPAGPGAPSPTINVFHSRSSVGAAAVAASVGAAATVLIGQEILHNADMIDVASNVMGEIGGQVPDLPAMDDIASIGGDVAAGLSDFGDLLP